MVSSVQDLAACLDPSSHAALAHCMLCRPSGDINKQKTVTTAELLHESCTPEQQHATPCACLHTKWALPWLHACACRPAETPEAFKDRMVGYDRDSAKRTQVLDDQSDWFDVDSNTWLSAEVCCLMHKLLLLLWQSQHAIPLLEF